MFWKNGRENQNNFMFSVCVGVCVGFIMWVTFGNMCTFIYCVLYCLYCVFYIVSVMCIFLLVLAVLSPSVNSIAVSSGSSNINNNFSENPTWVQQTGHIWIYNTVHASCDLAAG
jgi:hypothetical protein